MDFMQDITYGDLKEHLSNPGFILVNVLPAVAYEQAHIPGSISLPVPQIPTDAEELLPEKEAEIILYCASPK